MEFDWNFFFFFSFPFSFFFREFCLPGHKQIYHDMTYYFHLYLLELPVLYSFLLSLFDGWAFNNGLS